MTRRSAVASTGPEKRTRMPPHSISSDPGRVGASVSTAMLRAEWVRSLLLSVATRPSTRSGTKTEASPIALRRQVCNSPRLTPNRRATSAILTPGRVLLRDDRRLLLDRPSPPPRCPGDQLDPAIRICFVPVLMHGIKAGISHRSTRAVLMTRRFDGSPPRRIGGGARTGYGHRDLSTTSRYAQVANTTIGNTQSPFDRLKLKNQAAA